VSLRSDAIDMVVKLPKDGRRLALVIFDNEPIADPREREQLLRNKLGLCMHFAEAGRSKKDNADLAGKAFVAQVVCSYPPTPHMLNIDGLRDPDDKSLFMPVSVMNESEFKAQFGLQ
jgi:hypothetical protein